MFSLVETNPPLEIQESEYQRLLGYPKNHPLEGRARELADEAQAWFAAAEFTRERLEQIRQVEEQCDWLQEKVSEGTAIAIGILAARLRELENLKRSMK